MRPYTKDYFKFQQEGSKQSAKEIVPLVLELIQPGSVIDVGCGVGTWLSVFREYGIEDILGVDGNYIDREMLQIPAEKFLSADLKESLQIDRRFDLVLSLEVAEHLPAECAENFVKSIVGLGPVVLFSAAAPFQGGTGHVNEQWPNYWQKLFEKHGYPAIDAIRDKIWKNEKIQFWYRQNIIFFADKKYLDRNPVLKTEYQKTNINQLSIIHPELYLRSRALPSLKQILSILPIVIKNAFKRRLTKFWEWVRNIGILHEKNNQNWQ